MWSPVPFATSNTRLTGVWPKGCETVGPAERVRMMSKYSLGRRWSCFLPSLTQTVASLKIVQKGF